MYEYWPPATELYPSELSPSRIQQSRCPNLESGKYIQFGRRKVGNNSTTRGFPSGVAIEAWEYIS